MPVTGRQGCRFALEQVNQRPGDITVRWFGIIQAAVDPAIIPKGDDLRIGVVQSVMISG
jgi:hypothetical protein